MAQLNDETTVRTDNTKIVGVRLPGGLQKKEELYNNIYTHTEEAGPRSDWWFKKAMTTMELEQQTKSYWQQLSGASDQVKIALISLLSSSLMSKDTVKDSSEKATQVKIRLEDLEITPFVASIGQSIKSLPADFDYEKAKEDYLMQKYGW